MINSRHILNLSIELIIKAQASDKTFSYKCNVTKREAGRAGLGSLFKKVLKSFRRVLKSKNSLKS
jgi:hypothetical protein